MSEIIKTENLQYAYPTEDGQLSVPVLKGVNLSIRRGEFVAVLGHNGSGKSTLAGCFNAIRLPTGGVCYVDMMDTRDENNTYEVRKTVSMVFQNPDNQIIGNIVEEDVGFGPENIGVPTEEIWKRVEESLKAVGMTAYRLQSPNKLSGGQKQRLSIARAIAKRPELFIFDDSFSALDYKTDVALRKALKKKTAQSTVLIVAQRISTILHAEQIIVLDEGKIAGIGTHRELLDSCEVYRQIAASQLSEEELDLNGKGAEANA